MFPPLSLASNWARRFFVAPVVLLACALLASALIPSRRVDAQDVASKNGDAPAVVLQVDLSVFAKSEVGKLLIKAGTTIAADEMEKDPEEAMEAVIKSIGFNPLEQEAKLTALVKNIEDPLKGLTLDLELKDSTGNLEGLLLAVPEYRSKKQGDHTVHAVTVDNQHIHIVFHTMPSGKRRIIAWSAENEISKTLKTINDASSSDVKAWRMPEGQFVNLRFLSPPTQMIDGTPFAHVGQLLGESSLSLGEQGEELVVRITLGAVEEEKAIQLQQLAKGAVAVVGLFRDQIQEELGDEGGAQSMLPVLDKIVVEREGSTITIEAKIPKEALIQILREEADLPL